MKILVDWLTLTIKDYSIRKFLHEIHFTSIPYEIGLGGGMGYEHSIHYQGIHIYYNGSMYDEHKDMFTIHMSGKGCRAFESLYDLELNWLTFINHYMRVFDDDYSKAMAHVARIDIACDDKPEADEEPILNYNTLRNSFENNKFVCKARKFKQVKGTNTIEFERTIRFGSSSSDRTLRIYDKALERTENGKQYDGHWLRVEMQLRNDAALSFYLNWLRTGDIGHCYSGMLIDFLRFTTEPNLNNHHQDRLKTTKWWSNFTNNAEKIKGIYLGGRSYNLDDACRYIRTQAGSTIKTIVECCGGDYGVIEGLVSDITLNKRQHNFVEEFKHQQADQRLSDLKNKLEELGVPGER